jgi:hypothetical protein
MADTYADTVERITDEVAEGMFADYKALGEFIGEQPLGARKMTGKERLAKLDEMDDLVTKLRLYQGYGFRSLIEAEMERRKLRGRNA